MYVSPASHLDSYMFDSLWSLTSSYTCVGWRSSSPFCGLPSWRRRTGRWRRRRRCLMVKMRSSKLRTRRWRATCTRTARQRNGQLVKETIGNLLDIHTIPFSTISAIHYMQSYDIKSSGWGPHPRRFDHTYIGTCTIGMTLIDKLFIKYSRSPYTRARTCDIYNTSSSTYNRPHEKDKNEGKNLTHDSPRVV